MSDDIRYVVERNISLYIECKLISKNDSAVIKELKELEIRINGLKPRLGDSKIADWIVEELGAESSHVQQQLRVIQVRNLKEAKGF